MPPFNPKKYTKDLRPRFRSWDELNAYQNAQKVKESDREVPAPTPENDSMNDLNRFANYLNFSNLGWDPAPDGTIPKDRAGNSRLFALRVGEDGREQVVPLDGREPPLRSQAFWEEVQRGGVFAFPAGDDRPVQVQLSYTGTSTYPTFSKPVDLKDLPMSAPPPAPRRPNLFKRAVHAMFKNAFKQDFDTYARQKTQHDNWSASREAVKEQVSKLCAGRTGLHDQELADVALEQKRRAEAAEKERLRDQLAAAKKKTTAVEKAMSQAKAAWEPEPKIFEDENTKKRYPGRTVKAETGSVYDRLYHRKVTMKSGRQVTHEGFFNIDTFDDVKPIGKDQLDLGSIHKGESGKSFDTEDFVALTLAGTAVPRIGVQGLPYTSTADTTQVEALKGLKTTKMVDGKPVEKPCFTEEEALTLAADGPSMHYVTDVMDAAPRDGSGKFAKPVVEPARQLVKEALNQYKSGDPKALGEIIAHGIRRSSGDVTGKEAPPGTSWKGEMKYAGRLVEMLDADPKLADAAREAGMKEADLNTVRGAGELLKLDEKGAKANEKLAQAAAEGKDLPPEEKKQAIKDVIMAKLAVETMAKENAEKPCPEYDEMFNGPLYMEAYGMKGDEPGKLSKLKEECEKTGKLRPMPPPGRIYVDTASSLLETLKFQKKERPAAVILLNSPTYRKNLEKTAEQLLQEDKLMQKNPDQLVQELKYGAVEQRYDLGPRAMGLMSKNGYLDEPHRKEMAREVKSPAKARELADAFEAKQSQARMQEEPRKQNELAPKGPVDPEAEQPVV